MARYVRPTLDLDEAYTAVFLWLDHVGEAPSEITEPAHGVVELRSAGILARIRWSRSPIDQKAILALLRAVRDDEELLLFSVTGFTPGAITLADSQNVALLDLDPAGTVSAANVHARELVPVEPPPPPFADRKDRPRVPSRPDLQAPPTSGRSGPWVDCPQCGTTLHWKTLFCTRCGADLTGAAERAAPGGQPDSGPAAARTAPADPLDGATLRCRVCGSHDVEVVTAPPGSNG